MVLQISNPDELDTHLRKIDDMTTRVMRSIVSINSPIEAMRQMKFEAIGFHPIEGRPLNLIEQVNQTFTFLVALKATAWLFKRHPGTKGYRLAPGAKASLPLDIMSIETDLIGAETFASVHPDNNKKLRSDLQKLQQSNCQFRYAFFYSPGFAPGRIERLERQTGVEVHCVDIT